MKKTVKIFSILFVVYAISTIYISCTPNKHATKIIMPSTTESLFLDYFKTTAEVVEKLYKEIESLNQEADKLNKRITALEKEIEILKEDK